MYTRRFIDVSAFTLIESPALTYPISTVLLPLFNPEYPVVFPLIVTPMLSTPSFWITRYICPLDDGENVTSICDGYTKHSVNVSLTPVNASISEFWFSIPL